MPLAPVSPSGGNAGRGHASASAAAICLTCPSLKLIFVSDRGEFEERLQAIVEEVTNEKAPPTILFIDGEYLLELLHWTLA